MSGFSGMNLNPGGSMHHREARKARKDFIRFDQSTPSIRLFCGVRDFPCTVVQLASSGEAVAHYYPKVPLQQEEKPRDYLYSAPNLGAASPWTENDYLIQEIAIDSPNTVTASVIGPTVSVLFRTEPATERPEQATPFLKYDPASTKESGPVYFVNMSSARLKLTISPADNVSHDTRIVILQPTHLDKGIGLGEDCPRSVDRFSRYILTLNGNTGEIRSCLYPEAELEMQNAGNGWYAVHVPASKDSVECMPELFDELLRVTILKNQNSGNPAPFSYYMRKTDSDFNHRGEGYEAWLRPVYLINDGTIPCRLKSEDYTSGTEGEDTSEFRLQAGKMTARPLSYQPGTTEAFDRMRQELFSSPEIESEINRLKWCDWRPRLLERADRFTDDELIHSATAIPDWIIRERTRELAQYGWGEAEARKSAREFFEGVKEYCSEDIWTIIHDRLTGRMAEALMANGFSEEQARTAAERKYEQLYGSLRQKEGGGTEPHYATFEEEEEKHTKKIKEKCWKAASRQSYSPEEMNELNRICEELVSFIEQYGDDEDADYYMPLDKLEEMSDEEFLDYVESYYEEYIMD